MKVQQELWTVAECFGDLCDEVVFVGGMVRGLLVTDPAAGPARPTNDVDCIVDVTSAGRVYLNERLRQRGFREDSSDGAPICRWKVRGIPVDIMPTSPNVLGFSNSWYPSGLKNAWSKDGDKVTIRVVDAPHFCAMKIESFLGRGEGDYYHHDMEDLIVVIAERGRIVEELEHAPDKLRAFVGKQVEDWLHEDRFVEALAAHLPPDRASQARLPIVRSRVEQIASLQRTEI